MEDTTITNVSLNDVEDGDDDLAEFPDLTTTAEWLTVDAALLSSEQVTMHQNLKALADRQDLASKGILKMMDALLTGDRSKARRLSAGKTKLSHQFDAVVALNINQLADMLKQHIAAGHASHLMQTKNAPKSAAAFFETLEQIIDDPDHPLASVVAEMGGDEKAQTDFYVTLCRAVKSQDTGKEPEGDVEMSNSGALTQNLTETVEQ